MSYIDGFLIEMQIQLRVVERKDGKRVFKEYPCKIHILL